MLGWARSLRSYALLPSVVFCALLLPSIARAQLAADDIAALRAQGEREGWTFSVGPNPATAIPLEQLCGLVEPPDWRETATFVDIRPTRSLPTSFDWRDFGGVPPVRNQASCGSCWAFATVGPLECNILIREGITVDLSEQFLVSCNRDGWGCDGGWWAHKYHKVTPDPCGDSGAVLEAYFPYQADDLWCGCPYPHDYFINGWAYVGSSSGIPATDAIKQAILDYGPVSVAVYANGAMHAYTGGVFNGCAVAQVNHGVVLVGWDDNQGPGGVWIMRNSWGPGWGENGYMRMPYNCSNIGYAAAFVDYQPPDCNANGIPDSCEIDCGVPGGYCDIPGCGSMSDCNQNHVPDDCEVGYDQDCNTNGTPDLCDIATGASADCNGNAVPDECDIAAGTSNDINLNGVPDECEPDCNDNGLPDSYDIAQGASADINNNGIPDECEPDCNENGLPDDYDIAQGTSDDINSNGVPDECEPDCNNNGLPDGWDITTGTSADVNNNRVPDECEPDCNNNGLPDDYDIAQGTASDCDANGVPDSCDVQDPANDCNANAIPDACDLLTPPDSADPADDCAAAQTICPSGTYLGSTVGATPDGESTCGASNGTPDVWYYYEPAGGGLITISLCESLYDTVLSVHSGCPGTAANEIACNDDTCGDRSRVILPASVGSGYWIRVAGHDGATGDFVLRLSAPPCAFDPECNNNGIPDECEADCNGNGRPDDCDIADGISPDANGNGVPDECDGQVGDANCDGAVNAGDIDAFVLAITDSAGYATAFPGCDISAADCNNDGTINAGDIDPFVQLLTR